MVGPIEGFMVRLADGSIWEVKGFVHPPKHLICYPRYLTSKYTFGKTGPLTVKKQVVRHRYTEYLKYLDFLKEEHPCLPIDHICTTYNPLDRREEILEEPKDPLESSARGLLLALERAGADISKIGITGSMLVGLHSRASDIDLVVYGARASREVYEALLELRRREATKPLTADLLEQVLRERTIDTPECETLLKERVLEGIYSDTPYSVKLCEVDQQLTPGDFYVVKRAPPRTYHGRITCAYSGYMIPWPAEIALRRPCEVTVKVFTLRMRFTEIYREGVQVKIRGSMEAVKVRGEDILQVSVNRPGDYICTVR